MESPSLSSLIAPSLGALVLVWDSQKEESLQELYKWTEFIELHQPSILLCVQQSLTPTPSSHSSKAEQWCLENGLESVFVSLTKDVSNEMSQQETRDVFQEKEGVDRILEALQANMWTSHHSHKVLGDQNNISEIDSIPKHDENDTNKEETDQERLESFRPKKTVLDPEIDIKLSMLENLSLDDEDHFEKFLSIIQPLRQNSQKLPDDQRRELAARVALLFASQMEAQDDDEIEFGE